MTHKICLRCGHLGPAHKFEAAYFVHEVCNSCRKFMAGRRDRLILVDKVFHKEQKMDYEVTKRYLADLIKQREKKR